MSSDERASFQELLTKLFERGLPDGTRATPSEVARRAQEAGFQVSRPYIGQLRSGRASNPALATIEALATVFEVEPNYFFGVVPPDSGVAYEIAARAAEDPEATLAGLGDELDEEGRRQLVEFSRFLHFKQRNAES